MADHSLPLPSGVTKILPMKTEKVLDLVETEKILREYLRKLILELREKRRLSIGAFCRKYKIPRETYYRTQKGRTTLYSDKLFYILISEGVTLDLEKIYKEVILKG